MAGIKNLIREASIKHIAIIMDGNGRWASARDLSRTEGHKVGSETVIDITEACDELGIKYLSLYAFSTENWKRPKTEVSKIMSLLNKFISRELNRLHSKNIKLNIMGDITKLPIINRKAVEYALNKTKNNTGLVLNIGLNYGSRDEIVSAFKSIHQDLENKKIKIEDISEKLISSYMYTYDMPDPDLLIRTGGELRLSNFMLYQLAYSEFYFTDVLWPDFDRIELEKAILEFLRRNRRFGGLNA
ncbi:MAG: isoprenyl transferase [Tissierellia bacterium]|nr:isoprenyl transferase [Tissierellia bacterium]